LNREKSKTNRFISMSKDRRSFLKTVGTGAAAAAAVTKIAQDAQGQEIIVKDPNFRVINSSAPVSQVKIAFELDGEFVGWVNSVEGGEAVADVVTEKQGSDGIARKHISGVKYEDITVTCGFSMSKAIYDWIASTFDHKHTRKSGSIVTVDYTQHKHEIRSFANALITEIGFPALDASSKDAAKMTLKFAPEYTKSESNSGRWFGEPGVSPKQKLFQPSNFRLTIDGLEQACAKVSKIDAITVKQTAVTDAVGEERDYEKEPAKLEFPNLKITLDAFYAEDFLKWHEDFVIKGNSQQEKGGTLEYLAADMTSLFTLNFYGVGIFKAKRSKQSDTEQKATTLTPEMYCETIKFWMPNILVDGSGHK
jgi:phage tail-like protein